MLYSLEQGPHEQLILQQCMRDRRPIPPEIANAPELRVGLELYYNAFWDLMTSRPIGMAQGPIGWYVIHQYATAYEFSEEQAEDLLYFVSLMDAAYMDWSRKKEPKK